MVTTLYATPPLSPHHHARPPYGPSSRSTSSSVLGGKGVSTSSHRPPRYSATLVGHDVAASRMARRSPSLAPVAVAWSTEAPRTSHTAATFAGAGCVPSAASRGARSQAVPGWSAGYGQSYCIPVTTTGDARRTAPMASHGVACVHVVCAPCCSEDVMAITSGPMLEVTSSTAKINPRARSGSVSMQHTSTGCSPRRRMYNRCAPGSG
jgi:hypothetical protein